MSQDKIVVVMGGPSTEAEVSRRSGAAILKALRSKGYQAEGMELEPRDFAKKIQESGCRMVFNGMHGKFGEDGVLQGTLDMLGIPYTGSGVLASAVTMDKVASKRVFSAEGIPTPRYCTFHRSKGNDSAVLQAEKEFSFPMVVKAASQGSSIGVYIAGTHEELAEAVKNAFSYDVSILVEEFINGRELTVAVWGNEDQAEALPVIEITTVSGRYDYDSKYTAGASTHIVPAQLSEKTTKLVQEIAVRTFLACGCKGVARVDIIMDQEENPYVMEVNSAPGMTELSLVPDAGRAVGLEFPDLCEKILEMAGFPVNK